LIFSISSCKNQLDNGDDTNKLIDSFVNQAEDSAEINPTFSRFLLRKAMGMTTDSLFYYEALSLCAKTYCTEGRDDSSYFATSQVKAFCKKQDKDFRTKELIAESDMLYGDFFKNTNEPDSAIFFYKRALESYSKLKKMEKLPEIYINLARVNSIKEKYAPSVNYYRKALFLSDSLNITLKMIFPIYYGLGQIYKELRDFELSDSYFLLAEKYYNERSLCDKFLFCNNRGGFFYDLNNYPKALIWGKRAKALVEKTDMKFMNGVSDVNLADIYLNLDKLDSTRYFLDKSISYFSTKPHNLANYYIRTIEIGLALKQNNLSAVRKLITVKEDLSGIDLLMVSLRNKYLGSYFAKIGDFRQAYRYQSINQKMNDSILEDRSIKSAAESDVRYKLDTTVVRKDLLISHQESQLNDLRLIKYVWILVCLLFLTIAFFVYLIMKRQRDLQRLKYIDQVTKLRMQNIRNQISPHFILNILNREIISVDESKRDGLYGLAKLLRESLDMTELSSISLEKELDFVQTYIELERNSLGPDFELQWEVDSWINLKNTRIPPMIIQIPIENAIKQGLRSQVGKRVLNLSIAHVAKGIMITIQDNGIGYFPGEISNNRGTGTGMNILYQTIQLLNSKNTVKIVFRINNADQTTQTGARVELFIPSNFKYE